jgi:hypothetical protein
LTLTEKDYRAFFKQLKRSFPVPNRPPVVLRFRSTMIKTVNGQYAYGMVQIDSKNVKVTICTCICQWLVVKIIAHEYKHIMQRYLDGWLPDSRVRHDHRREGDAHRFGNREALTYMRRMKGLYNSQNLLCQEDIKC